MSRGYAAPQHLVALSIRGHALEQQAAALLGPDERQEVYTRRHLGYGLSSPWARIRQIPRREIRQLCAQADLIWWKLAQSHEKLISSRASFYARKLGYEPEEVLSWAWLGAYAGARCWRPSNGSLYSAIKIWVKNWILVSSAEERGDLSGAGHSRAAAGETRALRLDQPLRAGEPDCTLLDMVGVPAPQLDQVIASGLIRRGLARCSPMQRADLLAAADGWEGAELADRRGVTRQTVSDSILEGRRRFVAALSRIEQ